MIWGEFQSVFQIIAGLNIAFYAIKEIRLPYATRATELVEDVVGYIRLAPRSQAGIDIVRFEVSATLSVVECFLKIALAVVNFSECELNARFLRIAGFQQFQGSDRIVITLEAQ